MNKKIIWKFNIIDLVIIGILVLSVSALIYKLTWGNSFETKSYEFTYLCDEAPLELLDEISTGSVCIDGELGTELGYVTEVAAAPLESRADKGRGMIKVAVSGVQTEHGVTIGDSVYLKGKKLDLIVGGSIFEVYISNIAETE